MITATGANAPSVEAFAAEADAFLASAVAHFGIDDQPRRTGRIALFPELSPEEEAEELAQAKAWRAYRFDNGFGWIPGPTEHGGRGLTAAHERAYVAAERRYTFPTQRLFDIGTGMVAPTILAWGSDELKQTYLRALQRGDIVGCQLFSEPGAGSDLASLSTRAVRDGGEWRIDGQKVWTSGAHLSDVGLLACRSGTPEARHRNITVFLLPMATASVTVRPIRQMTGGTSFNEVFLDDVRVSDSHRLGDVDGGWQVIITTLLNERAAVGGRASGGRGLLSTARVAELLRRFGRADDPAIRDKLMRVHCAIAVDRLTRERAEARRRAGQPPGPEMSIGKLALTQNLAGLMDVVGAALGPRLLADTGEDETFAWAELLLGIPGLRLGGGTDEIQRNIVAERVLGLPR